MSYNDAQLEVIDRRIQAALARLIDTAVGTVSSVDGSLLRASVLFDGSTVAAPVKLAGHVNVIEGDRVGLQRFGADWVVMCNNSARRWPDDAGYTSTAATGSTSSATYAGFPGPVTFSFTKLWTATRVRLHFGGSCYTETIGCLAHFGLNINGTDYDVSQHHFADTAGAAASIARESHYSTTRISGVAAGTWTVTARWKRTVNGTVFVNSDDWISVGAREIDP